MKLKTIRQSATFGASPHEVYEALMDSRKHSKFTEAKSSISREIGGTFTAYDGYAEGVNLELVKDKKIAQKWRADDWPEGHYSTVTFELEGWRGDQNEIYADERPGRPVRGSFRRLGRALLGQDEEAA